MANKSGMREYVRGETGTLGGGGRNGCFRPGFITPGWEMVGSVCACVRAPVVFPLSGHL